MENFKNARFTKQLAVVIFILLIFIALLSQPFPALITLARPFAIIFACLFIWLYVSHENSIFKQLFGICFISIILLSTLLFWVPFSSNIIVMMLYAMAFLFFIEFTLQAKVKTKATISWLIFVPIVLLAIGLNYFFNEFWWIPFLAFPVSWSFMALYAECNHFKNIINKVGVTLLGLMVICYVAVIILSLASISEIIQNDFMTHLFTYSGSVPIIQLGITLVFIPFLISWGISLGILNYRIKNFS